MSNIISLMEEINVYHYEVKAHKKVTQADTEEQRLGVQINDVSFRGMPMLS